MGLIYSSGDYGRNVNGLKRIISHLPLNNSPLLNEVSLLPDLSEEINLKFPTSFKCETKWIGFDGDLEVPKTLKMDGLFLWMGKYQY